MLPERLEIEAYYDKKHTTCHRVTINKLLKECLSLPIKPYIPKDIEFKLLLMGEDKSNEGECTY